jgi:hypothetical protein
MAWNDDINMNLVFLRKRQEGSPLLPCIGEKKIWELVRRRIGLMGNGNGKRNFSSAGLLLLIISLSSPSRRNSKTNKNFSNEEVGIRDFLRFLLGLENKNSSYYYIIFPRTFGASPRHPHPSLSSTSFFLSVGKKRERDKRQV